MLSSDIHYKENDEFRNVSVHPGHAGLHKDWPWLHEHHNHCWQVPSVWIQPRAYHFPHNENPTRALNTTSLQCCLASTRAIDWWEKIHTCIWRFKVASCKRIWFLQKKKKVRYFSNKLFLFSTRKVPPQEEKCYQTTKKSHAKGIITYVHLKLKFKNSVVHNHDLKHITINWKNKDSLAKDTYGISQKEHI